MMSTAACPTARSHQHLSWMEKINGPFHKEALWFYTAIVLAHWAEHLLQAFQIYALGWPVPLVRLRESLRTRRAPDSRGDAAAARSQPARQRSLVVAGPRPPRSQHAGVRDQCSSRVRMVRAPCSSRRSERPNRRDRKVAPERTAVSARRGLSVAVPASVWRVSPLVARDARRDYARGRARLPVPPEWTRGGVSEGDRLGPDRPRHH